MNSVLTSEATRRSSLLGNQGSHSAPLRSRMEANAGVMSSRTAEGTSATDAPVHPVAGLCADVGGSFIKFASMDAAGLCGPLRQRPTPARDWTRFREVMAELADEGPRGLPLCLSIAGVVDPETHLAFSANVPCVNGRRLAAELEAMLGRPVQVANDADCMVLAEALRGTGVGHRVVFGIVLGSGVGGGLVIDGRIVRGAGGIVGEWGHGPLLGPLQVGDVTVPPQPCGCGQVGCLDTLGGAHGLERLHRLVHGESKSSRDICTDWEHGEGRAATSVEAWLSLVAGPLAVMVNATGAGIVPVAGGLGNNPQLVAALDTAVRARILRRGSAVVVTPSRFGDSAGLAGAALLLRERPLEGVAP